jgi:hypothetical protein
VVWQLGKRFLSIALVFGTLGGLYVGAQAIDAVEAFWVLMAVALLLACVPPVYRKIISWVTVVGQHPLLVADLAARDAELSQLRRDCERMHAEIEFVGESGRVEGIAQVRGAIAANLADMPTIIAVVDGEQSVALAGTYQQVRPIPGARFFVIENATGEIKGVVESTPQRASAGHVILKVVRRDSPTFWSHLADRAEYDGSAPTGVSLKRYEIAPDLDERGRMVDVCEIAP